MSNSPPSRQPVDSCEPRASPTKTKDVRSQLWEFVLYPDSEAYDCATMLEAIAAEFDEWAYCLHDEDEQADPDTGEITTKKPHYHLMCHTNGNSIRLSTLQSRFPEVGNQIERGRRSYRAMVRYLVHADASDPLKKHYPIDGIVSNFDHLQFFPAGGEEAKAGQIYRYIVDSRCKNTTQLIEWSLENNLYADVRRAWTLWRDLMKEV